MIKVIIVRFAEDLNRIAAIVPANSDMIDSQVSDLEEANTNGVYDIDILYTEDFNSCLEMIRESNNIEEINKEDN